MTERKLQIESMLMALSKDKSKLVRAAVAENPNTPLALLIALSGDEEPWVRQAVAKNQQNGL
jgi:hypothetical protein